MRNVQNVSNHEFKQMVAVRVAPVKRDTFMLEYRSDTGEVLFRLVFEFDIFDSHFGEFAWFASEGSFTEWEDAQDLFEDEVIVNSKCFLGDSPATYVTIGSDFYLKLEGSPMPLDDLQRTMISMGLVDRVWN